MINFSNIINSILIILISSGTTCQADDATTDNTIAIPASMADTWQVTDVLVDQDDPRQGMGNKYLVPKYLGRIFKLAPDQLSINTPYDDLCENPRFIPRKMTASQIIGKSISTRMFSPSVPAPKDMNLPLANDAPVEVLYLSCNKKLYAKDIGLVGLADLSNVVWFINLENDKLAVSWHQESILVLNRLTSNDIPVASFDCAKASTKVEKTICGSAGLAAYDKSLGQAYKMVRNYYRSVKDSAESNNLKAAQIGWTKQRDACGVDTKCLNKVMSDRVSELLYELADYTYQHR